MSARRAGVVALAVAILAPAACTRPAPGAASAAVAGDACPEGTVRAAGEPPVCVDAAPVTVEQFDRCGPCVASHGFVPGAGDRPMTGATAEERAAYCRSVGKRLATEREAQDFRCAVAPTPLPSP